MTKVIAGGVAATAVSQSQPSFAATSMEREKGSNRSRPKVLFLDVNETLLDLSPLKKTVGDALGGRAELLPLWFKTMLQYSLVATVADRYEDFTTIGAAALQMVARNNDIDLTIEASKKAIEPILSLPPHPDVEPALDRLTKAGFQLVTLTNSTKSGVQRQMKNSGLEKYLTARLSVEEVGLFKPHAHVYRWAARKVDQEIGDCMLIAAHGWDIAGAIWAGMRGAFVSRPGAQLYPLGPSPEISEPTFKTVADNLIQLQE